MGIHDTVLEPFLQSGWTEDGVNRSLEYETEPDPMHDSVKISAGGDPQHTATLPFRNPSFKMVGGLMS